jgi:RNA polymerase sigma factor (sigma-70 family)
MAQHVEGRSAPGRREDSLPTRQPDRARGATHTPGGERSPDLVALVASARGGDGAAWKSLVECLKGVVWRATADTGLTFEDRQDVFAATFFRLFEHLDNIREPRKLPGWLATTARNEVRQVYRAKRRLQPVGEVEPPDAVFRVGLDEELLNGELRGAVRTAFKRLQAPCQGVLGLMAAVPPISYDQISELLGMPRGSLGPVRKRCLEHLRRAPELRPYLEGAKS